MAASSQVNDARGQSTLPAMQRALRLPEMLTHILVDSFDGAQMLRLRAVCKTWRDTIDSSPTRMKRHFFTDRVIELTHVDPLVAPIHGIDEDTGVDGYVEDYTDNAFHFFPLWCDLLSHLELQRRLCAFPDNVEKHRQDIELHPFLPMLLGEQRGKEIRPIIMRIKDTVVITLPQSALQSLDGRAHRAEDDKVFESWWMMPVTNPPVSEILLQQYSEDCLLGDTNVHTLDAEVIKKWPNARGVVMGNLVNVAKIPHMRR